VQKAKKSEAFLEISNSALSKIVNLFNLIWALDLGLWNLRKEVVIDKRFFPKATEVELAHKYANGSGIHGIDYKETFFKETWAQQQEELSWFLLDQLFSIYEGWAEDMGQFFKCASKKFETSKLSFKLFVCKLRIPESSFMKSYFYSTYSNLSRNHLIHDYAKLDNMMLCFRFFKDIMTIVHGVGDFRACFGFGV